jgi:hypothetical protein
MGADVVHHVDWFERLFGFSEGAYAETQSRLRVEGRQPWQNSRSVRDDLELSWFLFQ